MKRRKVHRVLSIPSRKRTTTWDEKLLERYRTEVIYLSSRKKELGKKHGAAQNR